MTRSVGSIRPSQLITTFGPGAIVDLPRVSALVSGIESWPTRDDLIVDEPRLARALGVRALFAPAVEERRGRPQGTIPSRVFPRYLLCPVCRLLAPLDEFRWDPRWAEFRCGDPRCKSQGRFRVLPSRFVVACERGHLDDFPFHTYVHGESRSCTGPLRLYDSGATGSISDIRVFCQATRTGRSLSAAFGEDVRILGPCTRRRPWLSLDDLDRECDARPWAVLRGASNLYFSVVRSALSVPPWADPINDDIARYETIFSRVSTVEELEVLLHAGNFPELANHSVTDVFDALQRRRQPVAFQDAGSLLRAEWQALRHPTRSAGATDFETEEVSPPEGYEGFIDQVVLAHRLREVRALQGFTRIEPPGSWGDEPDDPSRIAPLGSRRPDWLPAVVVRGEGVFIELKHDVVVGWTALDSVRRMVEQMTRALQQWRAARGLEPGPDVDARYVLMHTLGHLLIRRMSLDAGYSASSLRERVYGSSLPDDEMSGLLIYTASTDSDGSLGGLVDLGRPARLRSLLRQALEEARLCSSDPLCSDNEPHVKGMLNGAACHACMLASETSCERGNRLLDRAVLIETLAARGAQFFDSDSS